MLLRKLHTLVAVSFVFWIFMSCCSAVVASTIINLHDFNIEERRDYSESLLLGAKQCVQKIASVTVLLNSIDPLTPKSKKTYIM